MRTNGDADPEDDPTMDTSKADHYFWFDEGESEHIIEGFYKSPTESQNFVFAEPQRKRRRDGDAFDFRDDLDRVGIIRIVFCSVSGFEKIGKDEYKNKVLRKVATIDELYEEKIKIAAKPGAVVIDGVVGNSEAVLSKDIIYERRLVYNTYAGFSARKEFQKCQSQIDFYKGMPLEPLSHRSNRRRAVATFLWNVSSHRIDLEDGRHLEEIMAGNSSTNKTTNANEYIDVQDIVHFICESLSPAASYLLCSGKEKRASNGVRNYDEMFVQQVGVSQKDKFKDYVEKEMGLVDFFKSEPGTYDLKLECIDPTKNPPENYKVRFAVLELDDSSEEEDWKTRVWNVPGRKELGLHSIRACWAWNGEAGTTSYTTKIDEVCEEQRTSSTLERNRNKRHRGKNLKA